VAQDSQNTKYLFDYIYLDRDKLAAYSAQIFDHGALTSIKSVSGTQEHTGTKLDGGIPKLLSGEASEQVSLNESLERSFDAAWALPLNVINGLDEMGLVHRDITKANYGQMVLVKGAIQLIDLRMLQNLWGLIVNHTLGELPASTPAHKKAKQAAAAEAKNMAELVSKLPHSLQFKMNGENASVWSTLQPEHMIINPFDFAMKHGASIKGEWHMLAVVDAKPNDVEDDTMFNSPSPIEAGFLVMISQLKVLMGRQDGDYGVTPVAVFRKIE
jgi:hypothetical protein